MSNVGQHAHRTRDIRHPVIPADLPQPSPALKLRACKVLYCFVCHYLVFSLLMVTDPGNMRIRVPNDTASLIAAPEDASSTSDVEGSTSPQQQADSASAAAIDGTQQACVRERKLSRRLVECLESM